MRYNEHSELYKIAQVLMLLILLFRIFDHRDHFAENNGIVLLTISRELGCLWNFLADSIEYSWQSAFLLLVK